MQKIQINLMMILIGVSLMNIAPFSFNHNISYAQENRISIRGSNLEIPRFVTLKSNKVNMRAGPGKEYPIQWEYQRKGLPLKVIGEFDVWRKVTDHEGTTGWMHVRTLSVKRMVLITDTTVKIHRRANEDPLSSLLLKKVLFLNWSPAVAVGAKSKRANLADGFTGNLWGLLEGEIFE